MESNGKKSIALITGMHRSGTSFLSKSLHDCGLYLSEPHTLYHRFNEKGHWENLEFNRLGMRLFGPGDRWFNPVVIDSTPEVLGPMRQLVERVNSQGHFPWGWKDPRLMITYGHWRDVIGEEYDLSLVVIFRNPLEVAQSLLARDNIPLRHGLRLWERYNDHALNNLESGNRIHLVNYNAPDISDELRRICGRIGLDPGAGVIEHMYDASLHHHCEDGIPDMDTYGRLVEHWRNQRGDGAGNGGSDGIYGRQFWVRILDAARGRRSGNKPAGVPGPASKPGLRLAILIPDNVAGGGDGTGQLQLIQDLIEKTSPYTDFKIFATEEEKNSADAEFLPPEHRPHVKFVPKSGAGRLSGLLRHALDAYDVENIFVSSALSGPLKPIWELPIMDLLDSDKRLFGWQSEPEAESGEAGLNPPAVGLRAETAREILRQGKRKWGWAPRLNVRIMIDKTIRRFGDESVSFFGPHDESDLPSPFQEWNSGERASEFERVYSDLTRNHTAAEHQRLLLTAESLIDSDIEKAYFLLGLISRHYAFDTEFLNLYQKTCELLGYHVEAEAMGKVLKTVGVNTLKEAL